jgi:hypothetical protein
VTTAAAHDIELRAAARPRGHSEDEDGDEEDVFIYNSLTLNRILAEGVRFMKINGPGHRHSDGNRGIPFAPFRTKRLRGVFIDFHRARCANVATS